MGVSHLRPIKRLLTGIACIFVACTAKADSPPNLEIHGMTYESACTTQNWKVIHNSLNEVAKSQSPAQLTRLVRTWLCGSGAHADDFLRQNSLRQIPIRSEQTGIVGVAKSVTERSNISALGGRAWYVSVQGLGPHVTVSYLPNEACAASATFSVAKSHWRLAAMSEACD